MTIDIIELVEPYYIVIEGESEPETVVVEEVVVEVITEGIQGPSFFKIIFL